MGNGKKWTNIGSSQAIERWDEGMKERGQERDKQRWDSWLSEHKFPDSGLLSCSLPNSLSFSFSLFLSLSLSLSHSLSLWIYGPSPLRIENLLAKSSWNSFLFFLINSISTVYSRTPLGGRPFNHTAHVSRQDLPY